VTAIEIDFVSRNFNMKLSLIDFDSKHDLYLLIPSVIFTLKFIDQLIMCLE